MWPMTSYPGTLHDKLNPSLREVPAYQGSTQEQPYLIFNTIMELRSRDFRERSSLFHCLPAQERIWFQMHLPACYHDGSQTPTSPCHFSSCLGTSLPCSID